MFISWVHIGGLDPSFAFEFSIFKLGFLGTCQ